ncbi:hypothetical protein CERSUDRAFT_162933 [Gelatoporia subvermispora B]|uniref:Uncharacterized protein n=1 Tax=Ceriporiopsis subvermispora (strain B) TaxID=914234 RepID=M2QZU1_CERS8|nr:hypothetical protein CERSUDRAFT_162933 [Gelatoporia subvermispora B]
MRAAHGLAAAFKDAIEAKYATRAARMHAVAAANTSPSSSASSSPSPPCSPPPRPTPNGRLAQGSAAPDSQVDMDVTEALLPYNVFVLDASPADIAAKLPHLVARPEPPMRSAAHTDGTDAHTQGEGAEEAWRRRAARPNIVDFAVREREEMRDLTRASELITVLPPRPSNKDADDADERVKSYAGTTPASRFEPQAGQVFLGNAHDAPPTHPAAVTPFSPGANAPKCGRGFDLCIECYDFAPLPTMAQLRAAEGQIAALDRAWAEQCLADDEDGTGEARDAEELPTRPPPHHSVVVHLTFPSSPVATATSVNALLPILAFLERLIAPPAHLPTRGSARALLFPAPPQTHPPSHGSRRASEAGTFGPRSLPPPSAFPTSFFPAAHAQGPQAAYTRVRSTSATCPPGSSSPAPPSSPSPSSSTSAGSSPASPDAAGALRTRPAKVLVHSADGYTESSVLGLALLMAHRALPLPAAYLALQLEKRRSFFVYQADIPLLRRIEARLLRERAAREEDAREARGAGPASARERAPWGSWSRLSEKSVSFATGGGGVNMDGAAMQGDARPVAMHVCRTVSDSRPPGTFGAAQGRPRAHTLPLALPEGGGDELWFNDPKFDGSFPSRVLPFLYLGNLNHAANAFMLHALGITHVVSVGECALVPPPEAEAPAGGRGAQGSLWHEEREGRIKVLDIKGVCDDGIDTLAPQLEPICEWIERARAEGGTVLVHCRVGVSRSATVTIAYVMKHLQLPLVDAYLIVRSRRLSVLIQPNMRLLYNLLGWELHLARERAAGDEERLRYELARSLNWPYLAKEVHALNEKYLH